MEDPLCGGGYANIWKGQYQGREVAAKVLRVFSKNDLARVKRVGRPQIGVRANC